MSSYFENILNKNQKINFDFSKSINKQQFDNSRFNYENLPIEPKQSIWEIMSDNYKTFLFKTFIFEHYNHLEYFVEQILKYGNKIKHYPEIYITENHLSLTLYTKNLNDVTEIDIEFSKFANEIFNEINYVVDL